MVERPHGEARRPGKLADPPSLWFWRIAEPIRLLWFWRIAEPIRLLWFWRIAEPIRLL
jgi:hypothetical protein